MSENDEQIYQLITKASEASRSEDAMRFSQAAVNAANALAQIDVNRRQNAEFNTK